MAATDEPPRWTDPEYVATVVGVVAIGALVTYSSITPTGPTVDEVLFVLLSVTLPSALAYELARRFA